MVRAAGDCPGEHRQGLGQAIVDGHRGRDTDTNGGGGAAVEAQDDVGGVPGDWHLAFKVPHFPISIPLHLFDYLSLYKVLKLELTKKN